MKIKYKILFIVSALVLIFSASFIIVQYNSQKKALLDGIDSRLLAAAYSAKAMLPADFHDKITGKNSVSEGEYLKIVNKYNKYCLQLNLQYVWSVMMYDGQVIFTSGTSTSKDISKGDFAMFLDIHTNPQAYGTAFQTMEVQHSSFHDKWGDGRMVLIPDFDSKGRKLIFGASMSTSDVSEILNKTVLSSIYIGLFMLLIGIGLSFLIANSLSQPLEKMAFIAVNLTDGQLNQDIEIKGSFEVESLASSLNQMSQSIRQKILEIEGYNKSLTIEIAERKQVEESLKFSNERLMEALDSIPADIYIADMNTFEILYMNKQMIESFGEDYTGQVCWKVFRNNTEPCSFCTNPSLLDKNNQPTGIKTWEDKNIINGNYYLNYDRAIRWIDRRFVHIQIALNITERKQAEDQIKTNLKEKEILLHEIHHRVKNNMQIIASLLKMQLNSKDKKDVDAILKENMGRVYSMAAIHESLHQSEKLSEIDFKPYLQKLTQMLSQTYSVDPGKISFQIDTPVLTLAIDKANPLGLVLNELISNSLKYAFPDDQKGSINIKSRLLDADNIEIIVSDDGIGIPNGFDWKEGDSLGLKLVQNLVENQLGGSVGLDNTNGTKFTINFNLESNYK
jgi:two-component sensor histidine kinase/HAMP domain-containing protein